jgi:hypothetical protein
MKKWKIIFCIAALFWFLSLVKLAFYKADLSLISLISPITCGVSLVPLYGYAYQKPIGTKLIAVLIFIVTALMSAFGFILAVLINYESPNIYTLIGFFVLFLVLFSILYPQFMYAFKSNALWRSHA